MKRLLLSILLYSFLGAGLDLRAQDSSAILVRQEWEERFKRMSADIENLVVAQNAAQKRISALSDEIRALRDEMVRHQNNAVSPDLLKRLGDSIKDVDQRRVEDNKRIADRIEKLGTLLTSMPPAPAPRRDREREREREKPDTSTAAHSGPEEALEHTVARGDTLSGIVQAYREQKIMVSRKMVEDANPKINWDRLQIGQKVLIPKPK